MQYRTFHSCRQATYQHTACHAFQTSDEQPVRQAVDLSAVQGTAGPCRGTPAHHAVIQGLDEVDCKPTWVT